MIKVRVAGIAGLLAAGAVCAGVIIPAFSASPAKPVLSQEARAAMTQMGQTLQAKEFSFQAKTLRVYLSADGRFLHMGQTLKVVVRRPDRLRVDVNADDGVSQLFYDGKTLVLYHPAEKAYVSIPVPDTIEGMLKEAAKRTGLDFPLADFLNPAANKAILSGVTDAKVVYDVTIDGVLSRHLTLYQPPGIELEIWLAKNEQSLPERLFVTYRSIPGQPTFIATFSDWNFSVAPTDADFVFQPPAGAKQVALKAVAPPPAKAKGAAQ
jgi:hypothetical protein